VIAWKAKVAPDPRRAWSCAGSPTPLPRPRGAVSCRRSWGGGQCIAPMAAHAFKMRPMPTIFSVGRGRCVVVAADGCQDCVSAFSQFVEEWHEG